ncbi:MAG TPA: hypothetical protein VJH03_07055 [Blastocatellia bacterium]|nr:hypothetical protein [Blastocatellia bacterium]
MNRAIVFKILLIAGLAVLAAPSGVTGQTPNQARPDEKNPVQLDDVTISPSRVVLPMKPGAETTIVVSLIYISPSGKAEPTRVTSYLGDWTMNKQGKVEFYRPGTFPNSAAPWIVHSPGEMTIEPAKLNRIRVTISVPQDATPGDHLAVLFVEPRPDNLKLEKNRKRVQMKFRLGTVFYIMVPDVTRKGALDNLKAESVNEGILVTPRLRNDGNSHVRPTYSVKILDQTGVVVAEVPEMQSLPVLGGSEMDLPVLIEKIIPAGSYSVKYRVDFGGGLATTEGRTELVVKERLARAPSAAPAPTQAAKTPGNANR